MSAVRARAAAAQSPARAFLRDNGLTIALSTLFVLAIVAIFGILLLVRLALFQRKKS